MLGHERGDGPGQERQAHGRCAGDVQRTTLQIADVLGGARDPLDAQQRTLHFLIQRHGFGGGLQAPLDAVEQAETDVFLQAGDQPGRGRLGDVQHFGGAGHRLPQDHCTKGFQLAKVHRFTYP